ncbi:MAG: hypoxanthine phosphoribosyltransferase [Erysipelotrichaceae bacterium]|nr:hypoxanthine phosphoribosyltransferase [Erysipelotrichaceae bacterium]
MLNKDIEKVFFSEEEIRNRCEDLGKQIDIDYADQPPVLVGLLKGSVPFLAELMKHISINIQIDFMDVTSYSGRRSVGDVKIIKDLDRSIIDENVLIVEDIVDTGKTLSKVKEMLYSKGAKDVKIITLLNKEEGRLVEIKSDYVAFECPNEFVVGYGLDYNQDYRNLPYVGVLKEECYKE